jgi:hypothetical protein
MQRASLPPETRGEIQVKKFCVASIVASSVALFAVTGQADDLPKCSDDTVVAAVETILNKNGIGTIKFDQVAMDKWQKEFNAATRIIEMTRKVESFRANYQLKQAQLKEAEALLEDMYNNPPDKSDQVAVQRSRNKESDIRTIINGIRYDKHDTPENFDVEPGAFNAANATLEKLSKEKPATTLISKLGSINEMNVENDKRNCESTSSGHTVVYQIYHTEEHGEVTGFSVRVKWG